MIGATGVGGVIGVGASGEAGGDGGGEGAGGGEVTTGEQLTRPMQRAVKMGGKMCTSTRIHTPEIEYDIKLILGFLDVHLFVEVPESVLRFPLTLCGIHGASKDEKRDDTSK